MKSIWVQTGEPTQSIAGKQSFSSTGANDALLFSSFVFLLHRCIPFINAAILQTSVQAIEAHKLYADSSRYRPAFYIV